MSLKWIQKKFTRNRINSFQSAFCGCLQQNIIENFIMKQGLVLCRLIQCEDDNEQK